MAGKFTTPSVTLPHARHLPRHRGRDQRPGHRQPGGPHLRVLEELGHAVELVAGAAPRKPAGGAGAMPRVASGWFRQGALFYAAYNVAVPAPAGAPGAAADANDLDTLPACFLAARLKGRLVYDTHEFYAGCPELVGGPSCGASGWGFERHLPRLRTVMMVLNDSIARPHEARYPRLRTDGKVAVVRNIPRSSRPGAHAHAAELGLPEEAFILVLQGLGHHVDRGGGGRAGHARPARLPLLLTVVAMPPVLEELSVSMACRTGCA